jgi:hypothetical protein
MQIAKAKQAGQPSVPVLTANIFAAASCQNKAGRPGQYGHFNCQYFCHSH